MTHSIEAIPRAVRRRLKKTVHKSRDKDHARRAQALLLLAQGYCVTHVSELLSAARSSVQRWRGLYEEFGEEGLAPLERGRRCWTVTESLGEALAELLERSPRLLRIPLDVLARIPVTPAPTNSERIYSGEESNFPISSYLPDMLVEILSDVHRPDFTELHMAEDVPQLFSLSTVLLLSPGPLLRELVCQVAIYGIRYRTADASLPF